MGHCNHWLPSSIYHSPHVEHSLSPLLDFLWPQTTSLVLLYHWMWKASWSTTVLKNSILQSPLSLICRTNLWIKSVSGMDGAWWMLSGSNFSSDLGKYTVIIDDTNLMAASENSWDVWTRIWPDFSFRKMTFLLACLHSLELLHGVLHCRTSAMTYSRTLFRLIVENKSGSKLSIHTITPQNDIDDLPHSASTVSITFFRQLMLFYYGLSFWSPRLHFSSLSCLFHL